MFKRVALAGLGLFAFLGSAAFFFYWQAVHTPVAVEAKEIELEVPKGATLLAVGRLLEEQKLIRDARIWRLYLKLNPAAPAAKAGRHRVSAAMSIPRLLDALSKNPIPDDVPITMVEGWRLRDADAALAEKGLIEAGAYLTAASQPKRFDLPFEVDGDSLEGYLLPETYMVPPGRLDVDALIRRQLAAFTRRFAEPYREEIGRSGRSLRDITIMASLLEREEPDPATRPKVAGVLFKRIDLGIPLGVDATSRFTLEVWNDRRAFLKKLRDPEDPYNTRLKAGLPPTAIGAPSIDSLVAALRPVPSPYLYYLHDAKGRIHFAKTADGHEANRKRYNVW